MAARRLWWCILGVAISSCATQRYLSGPIHLAEKDFKDHIGLVLYDPISKKTIYDHQGDRYFTPASNTKILTFYSSLQLLGDSIPALRYVQHNDSLIFWGTGDPSFLYKNTCKNTRVYDFLKAHNEKLFFASNNFRSKYFGPGWVWDEYDESYQVEKTPFPIYGNRSTIRRNGQRLLSYPPVFTLVSADSSMTNRKSILSRGIDSNVVKYSLGENGPTEWIMPFHVNDELISRLLTDTLRKEVKVISRRLPSDARTLFSVSADSLYKVMMQASDNFIAEQLLMMCASVVSDTLKGEIAIEYVKKKFLKDMPDKPVWADGSGLSRYNLLTPRSVVWIWDNIYSEVPRDRLFKLLAVGGEIGNLKDYYKAEKPFIVGKTGTLANNHSLSGFLVTKRGRTLIFSWMNNNFTTPAREVRTRMESVLKNVYEKY